MTDVQEYQQRIKELEKANRILEKKLERSQANRIALEESNDKNESLLKKVIVELEAIKKNFRRCVKTDIRASFAKPQSNTSTVNRI